SGADEIQFDYVRFPAEGDQKDASFVYQTGQPEAVQGGSQQGPCGDGRPSAGSGQALARPAKAKRGGTATKADAPPNAPAANAVCKLSAPRGPQRSDVITAFLQKAYAELHPTGVLLSLDVFGVMAWQR